MSLWRGTLWVTWDSFCVFALPVRSSQADNPLMSWAIMFLEDPLRLSLEVFTGEGSQGSLCSQCVCSRASGSLAVSVRPTFLFTVAGETWYGVQCYRVMRGWAHVLWSRIVLLSFGYKRVCRETQICAHKRAYTSTGIARSINSGSLLVCSSCLRSTYFHTYFPCLDARVCAQM